MAIRPILSAMLRNKTGAILVGLQIAITLAVVANSVFIITQRVEKINRPSGIDSENLFFVQSYGYGPNYNHRETVRHDLDLIRAMPGVVAASVTGGIPLSGGGQATGYSPTTDKNFDPVDGNVYNVDEYGVEAFGITLAAGRSFTEQEIQYDDVIGSKFVPSIIITQAMAKDLFGDQPALGKNVYDNLGQSAVVVGVIDHMLGAWVDWDELDHVALHPRIPDGPSVRYVVRAEPGRRGALILAVEKKLSEADLSRSINWVRSHEYYTERSYKNDSRMVALLSVMIVLMIAVTALGIVGLASFHVNQRRKQIGTRRAVGARRIDIIRYFMLENWLLTTAGVFLGAILAFAFGQWLSSAYSLPRLEPWYVAAGIVLLWILGQLAVYVPARRAAAIPPALATRTV
jgi:putative ABC transport system permease protein